MGAIALGLSLVVPVETAAASTSCYPSLQAQSFTSVCHGELVDAMQYVADGKTLRRYEVAGGCAVSGMEHCLYVEIYDDGYYKDEWNQAFKQQFVFSKAILTWDKQAGIARVQGYLVGDPNTELLGSPAFATANFMDMSYQCGTDPFLSPLAGCLPMGKTLGQFYKKNNCPPGGDAVCPPFAGEVVKAEAEAMIQKKSPPPEAPAPKVVSRGTAVPVVGAMFLPKVALSLVSTQSTIDPACTTAAEALTVSVTVSNGTLPLAAGLGTIAVSETGGAQLSSGRIPLPAFGSGQTRVLSVPVSAAFSAAPSLPGPHQLQAELQPKIVDDQASFTAKPKSLPLTVNLPSGFCEQSLAVKRQPGPGADGKALRRTVAGTVAQAPDVRSEPERFTRRSTSPDQGREVTTSRERAAPTRVAAGAVASAYSIEAERLAHAGKITVNGGDANVQDMSGFGPGWSNDAQLFWTGGTVGAVLDLAVDVPAAGTYAVELYLTRAPDYADLDVEIDGQPSAVTVPGYASGVLAPEPVQAGRFTLQPGAHKVSFMIRGKSPRSTGYFVGIDRIVFRPAGQR